MGAHDPDSTVAAQYAEAGLFLAALADELVDGNRSRVVIVPGNHDVHWGRSLDAMKPLEVCPERIATKALDPTSRLRWNWREQTAYEVADIALYHFSIRALPSLSNGVLCRTRAQPDVATC